MMWGLVCVVLAACSVPGLAQPGFGGPFGGGPFGGGPGGPGGPGGGQIDPSSCAGQGYSLPKGACSAYVSYFQSNSGQAYVDQATFQTLVNNAPTPSGECCQQASYFVSKGCPCDNQLLSHAGALHLNKAAIYAINRALPISPCHGQTSSSCPPNAGLSS